MLDSRFRPQRISHEHTLHLCKATPTVCTPDLKATDLHWTIGIFGNRDSCVFKPIGTLIGPPTAFPRTGLCLVVSSPGPTWGDDSSRVMSHQNANPLWLCRASGHGRDRGRELSCGLVMWTSFIHAFFKQVWSHLQQTPRVDQTCCWCGVDCSVVGIRLLPAVPLVNGRSIGSVLAGSCPSVPDIP